MFRDNDFRYLGTFSGFCICWSWSATNAVTMVCNAVTIYQGLYNGIWPPDPVEIVKWQSNVVPVAIIILATIEALRVIADRIIKRLNQKDREETLRQAFEYARQQARQESAKRWNEAITRFGVRGDDGVVRMDVTSEVLHFLLVDTDSTNPDHQIIISLIKTAQLKRLGRSLFNPTPSIPKPPTDTCPFPSPKTTLYYSTRAAQRAAGLGTAGPTCLKRWHKANTCGLRSEERL